MSAQATAQTQMMAKPTFTSATGRILQRACACGQHAGNGGECEECKKKRDGTLQRAAIQSSYFTPHSFTAVIQTKLAINKPGDEYEQEADRIADQIMSVPLHHPVSNTPPRIQRFAAQPTVETETAPASVDLALASPGGPLEPALRQDMEQRFGYDFSQVRVHTGAAAEQSAGEVSANAYTVGANIIFGAGQFAPETNKGRRLIAHELIHVLQQQVHPPMIQRQPSTRLLSQAASAAAVAYVIRQYDADSIRMLEFFSGRTPDGAFDTDDAEALAKLQQQMQLVPSGKADQPLLDAMLKILGSTVWAHNAMIRLVVDHANLDASKVLAIVYDPGTPTASDIDTLPGGVSIIQIGNAGFASYRVMVAELTKQLAVRTAASPVTPVPATVLTDVTEQQRAIITNGMVSDPRSIKLLQGALGSKATGKWDVELVRHIAAKQHSLGLTPNGILEEPTLAAIGTEMIANGSQDAALQLIVDYYNLDSPHAFSIVFAPNPPSSTRDAEAFTVGHGARTPGVVRVYASAFAKPWARLVHIVAHELGHIQQDIQGITSENVKEYLSAGIEIESRQMPTESIESDADIDLMMQNKKPVHFGFISTVQRMLYHWDHMTSDEKRAQHRPYVHLRSIVIVRIANEGTASQRTKLAPLEARLRAADAGVPYP